MKLSIAVWLCASALACSHESRPPSAPAAATPPASVARLDEPPVAAPPATDSRIPAAPAVAPPVAPPAPAETPMSMTPAAGMGTPRSASAQLVPSTPAAAGTTPAAPADKAESAQDRESIREIRALLASDQALAPVAPRLVIVARNGRIWLRGQVNTAAQRAAIEKAARQAVGVINVNNELVALE